MGPNKGLRVRSTLLIGAALAALPAFAAPVFAQDVAPGGAPTIAEDEPPPAGDIIVTAQRRNERLEDVPMSVSVVTQDTIAAAGVTSLRDLSNVTSGLQIGAGGAFPQPSLRGVTTLLNGTFENNVAVYVDGVYQPVAQAINIDLPNVDTIQVLKGPQGTLYGRNATGGAILLTTINPSDVWRGKAELTYASYDDKRASAYVAGPISDMFGISVAGYIRRADSYNRLLSRTNLGGTECCATPVEQDALRAKLRATLTDSFTATLAFNYIRISDSRSNVYMPIENVNPGGTFQYGTRPGAASLRAFLAQPGDHLGVQAYDIGNIMESKQYEGALTLEWETGIGTLQSITSYSSVRTLNGFDFDGSYIPASYSFNGIAEDTWQQAINYNITAIDRLNVSLGGLYFNDHLYFDRPGLQYTGLNPANPGTSDGSLATDYLVLSQSAFDQKKEAWAVYADATFEATDRLFITVGGRYSSETQNVFSAITGPAAFATFGLFRDPQNVQAKFSRFTPRASIRYEISPRTNVYASYSQGFRSGAFNSQAPLCVNASFTGTRCTYDPAAQETINAYEIGFKTAGGNFHFETAAFYYDYKNLQVASTTAISGFPVTLIQNAPKAKIYGIDGSFDWQPIENLTIRGSGTWLHSRYGDGFLFSGTGVCFSGPSGCGVGLNTNSDPLKTYLNQSQTSQDLSGLQTSRAPNFSGNLGFDYLIPMGDGGIRLAANVRYTSSYVATNPSIWCQPGPANNQCAGIPADRQRQQRFRVPGYALVNASIQWTDPTDHFYVRLWGTNLTNHRYQLHYSGTASGTYAPMAEPRVFGVTLGAKFNGTRRTEEPVSPLPPPPPSIQEEAPPPPPPPPPPSPPTAGERG